jgi:hypothetical protein
LRCALQAHCPQIARFTMRPRTGILGAFDGHREFRF